MFKISTFFKTVSRISRNLGYYDNLIKFVENSALLMMAIEETHIITDEEIKALSTKDRQRYIKLAYMFVRDEEAAKDIFQDSLLHLWMSKDSLNVINTRTYFAGIIKYRCLNYLRDTSRHNSIKERMGSAAMLRENEKILAGDYDGSVAAMMDIDNMLKICQEKLPPLTFKVFISNRFNGLTYKQIAKQYGISERKVVAEIQKALAIFRFTFRAYPVFVISLVSIALTV